MSQPGTPRGPQIFKTMSLTYTVKTSYFSWVPDVEGNMTEKPTEADVEILHLQRTNPARHQGRQAAGVHRQRYGLLLGHIPIRSRSGGYRKFSIGLGFRPKNDKKSRKPEPERKIDEIISDFTKKDPYLIKKAVISRYLHEPFSEIVGKFSADQINSMFYAALYMIYHFDWAPFNQKK